MKKIGSLFLAVLFLISLTACGSSSKNEITCSFEYDSDGTKATETVRTDKDDKIIKAKETVEYTAESEEDLNDNYELYKAYAEEMNEKDGVKYQVSKKGLTLITTMEVDFNKASNEVITSLFLGDTGTGFKEIAESIGATCK